MAKKKNDSSKDALKKPTGFDSPNSCSLIDDQEAMVTTESQLLPEFAEQFATKYSTRSTTEGMEESVFSSIESEPAVDAWVLGASLADQAMPLSERSMETSVLEYIIDEDDRIAVPRSRVREYPYRCICSLRIRTRDGKVGLGTGWLVGPRTVITAGHCVFLRRHGGWAGGMEVYPARYGNEKPIVAQAESLMSVEGWTEHARAEYDYGAIRLDRDIGALGRFGYAAFSSKELLGFSAVHVAGYPGDKNGTMWGHARKLMSASELQLEYDIDTINGNSGGPVFVMKNDRFIAVGIHNYGNPQKMNNSATRITENVFQNIQRWEKAA
jgi:V8-like Glu-specific endopeptidase